MVVVDGGVVVVATGWCSAAVAVLLAASSPDAPLQPATMIATKMGTHAPHGMRLRGGRVYEDLTYEEQGHVGVITLRRPEARNALTFRPTPSSRTPCAPRRRAAS